MLIINTNINSIIQRKAPCENVSLPIGIDNKPFSIGANLFVMKIKKCGIYKITSPSKKVYIGQSNDIHKRFLRYRYIYNTEKQTKLYRSFKKYGVKKHKFEILQLCLSSELNEIEVYYIELYQSCSSTGLNIFKGGCQNNFGFKNSKEAKLRRKLIGMPKNALPASNKVTSIPVNQLSLSGEFIKRWDAMNHAAKYLNCNSSSIKSCLLGLNKTGVGFKWEYADKNKVSKKTGQKPSESFRKATQKPIIQYDRNGVFIKEWGSISEAARQLKTSRNTIKQDMALFTIKSKFMWKLKQK